MGGSGFLTDLGKYIPGRAIPAITRIVAVGILSRILPIGGYGLYSLILITSSAVSSLFLAWIHPSVIRYSPIHMNNIHKLDSSFLNTVLILTCCVGTVAGLLSWIAIQSGAIDQFGGALHGVTFGGLVLSEAILGVGLTILRSRRKAGVFSVLSIWQACAGLGFGVLFAASAGLQVEGLVLGVILANVVGGAVCVRYVSTGTRLSLGRFDTGIAIGLLKYGLPLVPAAFLGWLLNFSDRWVIAWSRGAKEVGIYSASYAVANGAIQMVVGILSLAAGPVAIAIWEKHGLQAAQRAATQITRCFLLICIPAVIGLATLANIIGGTMLPPEYREGVIIMPWVALAGLLHGLQLQFQIGILYAKRTYAAAIGVALAGIANVAGNLVLIPRFGYRAAAWTTAVSYLALLAYMVIVARRWFTWRFPVASAARAIVSSSVMMGVLLWSQPALSVTPLPRLLIGTITGMLSYGLCLVLFGEVTRTDLRAVLSRERWR